MDSDHSEEGEGDSCSSQVEPANMKRGAPGKRRSSPLKQQKSVQEDPTSPTTERTTSKNQIRQTRTSTECRFGKGVFSMYDTSIRNKSAPYIRPATKNGQAHGSHIPNGKNETKMSESSNGVIEKQNILNVAQNTGCISNGQSHNSQTVIVNDVTHPDSAPVHIDRKLSKEDSSDKEHSSLEQDALSLGSSHSAGPSSLEEADIQNGASANDAMECDNQETHPVLSHSNNGIAKMTFQSMPCNTSFNTNKDVEPTQFQSMSTAGDLQGWAYAKSETVIEGGEDETLLSADKLEIDTILTQNVQQQPLSAPPREVVADCADFALSKPKLPGEGPSFPWSKSKKPEERNELFISHEYQTDSELGDRFGAKLETFVERDYNRHILTNILPDSPAEKMKIENNDEIVVFNDVFAPQLSHTDILNMFQHLPVDGRTTFDLIIRRKVKKNKKWQWYDSSAILAPDVRKTYPNVGNTSFAAVPQNQKVWTLYMKYKIPDTNLWLELHESGPKVSPGLSGEEKTVRKACTVSQDRHTGDYTWNCTLYGCACNMYLTIDSQHKYVKMQKIEPKNFQYWRRGGTCFLLDDLYLACTNDYQITVSKSEYMFDEEDAHTGLDHPDNSGHFAQCPSLGQPDNASHHVHEPGVEHLDVADTMVEGPGLEQPDVAGPMVKGADFDQPTHALLTAVASNDSVDSGYRSGYVTPERGNSKRLLRSNTVGLSNPFTRLKF